MCSTSVLVAKCNSQLRKQIVDELYEAGVCTACVLRFLCVRSPAAYSSADQCIEDLCLSDNATSSQEPVTKRMRMSSCVTCLGIMQDLCDCSSILTISKHIREAAYDADTFLFSVSIPACLQIRQHSMLLTLKQRFPDVYNDKAVQSVPSVKESWKWTMGPAIEKELGITFQLQGSLDIAVSILYDDDQQECDVLQPLHSDQKSAHLRKTKCLSRSTIQKLLTDVSTESFMSSCHCPPLMPSKICHYGPITYVRCPLFIAGRYNKYSRKISQTPWIIDGKKLMETSVQDLICGPIVEAIEADEIIFSSSGREDVDVRTLGKGRPFLLHIVNPRRSKLLPHDVKQIEEKINGSTADVAVRYLQVVPKEEIVKLKEGEEEKVKSYTALCHATNPVDPCLLSHLDDIAELEVWQKTPIRVLHRRPAAVRRKVVHSMKTEATDEHHFRLHLTTQAGTYIKEFVHGDFGRTTPNLCTLLANEVDILELDVQAIELDWPPEI